MKFPGDGTDGVHDEVPTLLQKADITRIAIICQGICRLSFLT